MASLNRPHTENPVAKLSPTDNTYSMTGTHCKTIAAADIHAAIGTLAGAIANSLERSRPCAVVGIANGGLAFATRLAGVLSTQLGEQIPIGRLNTNFHRDDIAANPIPSAKGTTHIPVDVTGADIILADDVIESGRTARAALGELFDMGRPARVLFVVLCERGCRMLPIQPDFFGFDLTREPEGEIDVAINENAPADSDQITIG